MGVTSAMMDKSILVKVFAIGVIMWALAITPQAWAEPSEDYPDREISNTVSLELLIDQGVPSHLIDVETIDGVVTLSGTVSNLLARERATEIAETVRGVRSVVNTIEVSTPDRPDQEIAADVERELLTNPVTESWEIFVACEDGRVTLTGTVESWQEKKLAERSARSVRGVVGVENEIIAGYEEDRPDWEIKEEVEDALMWDAYVDGAMIDVSVEDGDVALSGTVGSAAEKSRSTADAWVAGVQSVDAEDLKVAEWARNDRLREGKYVLRSDEEVEEAVEDAFLYDPRVNLYDVGVTAEEGVVMLTGTVGGLEAKRAAAEDARNTVGVWRVRNMIAVRPDESRTDGEIAKDVTQALMRNPFLDRHEIDVSVVNGLVFLEGTVQTWFEKGEADNVASRVEGVIDVENDLEVVSPSPMAARPYVDDWYLTDLDWYPERAWSTTLTDWEIRQNIRDELWWSPFVDSGDITVTVDDGIAHLTGTVDTMAERAAAEANAYQGGAIFVDNDLGVGFGPTQLP